MTGPDVAQSGSGGGGRRLPGSGLIFLALVVGAMLVGMFFGMMSKNSRQEKAEQKRIAASEPAEPRKEDLAWGFTRFVVKGIGGVLGVLFVTRCGQSIWFKARHVEADPVTGLLPLTHAERTELATGAFKSFHQAQLAEASVQFPKLTHLNARDTVVAEIAQVAGPPPAMKAPTFPELMKSNALRKGEIPIAWTPEGMIQGPPRLIRSGGVLGDSGAGKSTLFAGQIAWTELCEYAVFLGDLHAQLPESTTARIGGSQSICSLRWRAQRRSFLT